MSAEQKIIDWTIYALDRFAGECYRKGDVDEAALVDTTIQLYEDGLVAVTWEDGKPVYSLTPEAKIIMNVMKGTPEENALSDIKTTLESMNENE
jgi:hypothetical protein